MVEEFPLDKERLSEATDYELVEAFGEIAFVMNDDDFDGMSNDLKAAMNEEGHQHPQVSVECDPYGNALLQELLRRGLVDHAMQGVLQRDVPTWESPYAE